MLHAKFQDHQLLHFLMVLVLEMILKVFTINGHGSHLGHVIWTIYTDFLLEAPHKI